MSESRGRIMIVDDTPANLDVLSEILEVEGYEIVAFPAPELALAAALRKPPELFLLDVMMPGMTGYELCDELKQHRETRDVPVVFLSALTSSEDKLQAFSVGGVDYVTKPFSAPEVLARVANHIRIHRLQAALEDQNRNLEELVSRKVAELTEAHLSVLVAVTRLAEFRDTDTGDHIGRTQTYCRILAEALHRDSPYAGQIDDQFIELIYHAAPLHDIGKVGVPDAILLKPGKLDHDEFETMKRHVEYGVAALDDILTGNPGNRFIAMGRALTASHHEKWDGTGYPAGLAGSDIPLSGRIMAIADVYDALRSRRPYKEPFPHEKAAAIIRDGSESHFDPALVAAFMGVEEEFRRISEA